MILCIETSQLLRAQISDLTDDPEKLKLLPHNMTIYHRLLDPSAYKNKTVPSADELYEEGQALIFGGADTVGNTLMVGTYHLLQQPEALQKLKKELKDAWPSVNGAEPTVKDLESLPYLNAVIKESLRLSSGVTAGLLRVVPSTGATISGVTVPPGVRSHSTSLSLLLLLRIYSSDQLIVEQTNVACGSTFVHYNASIFPSPEEFIPERWLEAPELDNWLVAFSRGPRMCLGINLAWAELRLGYAHVFRKFDMEFAEPMPDMVWRDTFLPYFYGTHLKVNMRPVAA